MKRLKSFFIFTLIFVSYILYFFMDFRWDCVFKKYLHFACPGCGLTRSFLAILDFNFIQAVKYNILGIPLFIIGILIICILIKDIIKNENTIMNKIYKIMEKYYILIFIILIITMIINNINGV